MHGALYMPGLDVAYFVLPVCSLGYLSKPVCNMICCLRFFEKFEGLQINDFVTT